MQVPAGPLVFPSTFEATELIFKLSHWLWCSEVERNSNVSFVRAPLRQESSLWESLLRLSFWIKQHSLSELIFVSKTNNTYLKASLHLRLGIGFFLKEFAHSENPFKPFKKQKHWQTDKSQWREITETRWCNAPFSPNSFIIALLIALPSNISSSLYCEAWNTGSLKHKNNFCATPPVSALWLMAIKIATEWKKNPQNILAR